jgi:hypothetical protein
LNFESKIQGAQLEDQKQIKAQEGHLEEGKATKPVNGTQSGKPSKRQKRAEKSSETQNPLEINSP